MFFLLGHSLHWALTTQLKQLYFIIVRMNNPNRKLKGTDERCSRDEKTLKNCLTQNGDSLRGFLGRLHLSELGRKKKGSHGLVANSAGNQPSHRLGWLSYSASGFPIQLSERSPENWWARVSLCVTPGNTFGDPLCVISSPSRRQDSPRKNFRIEHCLKTKGWIWSQTNIWDLERKSKSPTGHDILPACFPEKPLA